MECVAILEKCLGKKAILNYMEIQPGDVEASWANSDDLARATNHSPKTPITSGITNFVNWYLDFYGSTK
jgi:UDP-glucuronate 4-epimerase